MKKSWIVNIRILSLVMVLVTGCAVHVPYFYSADSIEAWIVDEDTKEPLEGVVVVATWVLKQPTVAGTIAAGSLKIMETVSDKNGRFYFPAWGPKMVIRGQLYHETPKLIIFKSGYRVGAKSNDLFDEQSGFKRRSDWDGKVIPWPKFEGGLEEYADHLSRLTSMINSAFFSNLDMNTERHYIPNCGWDEIPIMTQAIHKAYDDFPPRYRWCQPLNLLKP